MQCPVCDVPLKMSERQGIEIDYCPQCRGVWLDRGELDKIIDRTAVYEKKTSDSYFDDDAGKRKRSSTEDRRYDEDDDARRYDDRRPRRRKSMLGELFDIFD